MKSPLVVIAGPTASGKTDLSIELSKQINGEIISGDSMQVYKYMNIGTAKPSKEEMQGIKHYLVDEIFPDEEYSVAIFQSKAKEYANDIYANNKLPVLVGGTGFYINAFVNNNVFTETYVNSDYRKYLANLAKEKGADSLHSLLEKVDIESAEKIHKNNTKRIIRALEYFEQTGQKISEHNKVERQKTSYYNVVFIILEIGRQKLYERINLRVDKMIGNGLIEEVEGLLKLGYSKDLVSMQGLGYKEIVGYLEGEIEKEQAIENLKTNTRRFAKRQLTWFRNQCTGCWINVDESIETSVLLSYVVNLVKSKLF